MKYYSDKTKKIYNSVVELTADEAAYDQAHAAELAKAAERKERAQKINDLRKEITKLQKEYNELITQFIKDNGSYHATYRDEDVDLTDIIRFFWW